MRRVGAIICLLVLSGCAAPATNPSIEDTDRPLGNVNGYTPTDHLGIDADGGLTERELEMVTYRSMARIEVLRNRKFTDTVSVEVISRETYRERGVFSGGSADQFANEVWQAAFVVDEAADVTTERADLYNDVVLGYYRAGEIVIVADNPNTVQIRRSTLVHELVHALQDQYTGIGREGTTIDEQRAALGPVEGEAEYLRTRYAQQCQEDWECLTEPEPELQLTDVSESSLNEGLYLSILVPYAEGPSFVAHQYDRGGWAAVDESHENRPVSTSQLIHPERYPDDRPVDIDIPDHSSDQWEPFANGNRRTETIGEATLFATLWANDVIDQPLRVDPQTASRYNYSHPITDGWAGDTVVAYHDDTNRTGHVWRLAWNSSTDANTFQAAYVDLLEEHNGTAINGTQTVYRIPDQERFSGAYRVSAEGSTVTIVGGPTVDALGDIHAAAPAERPAARTASVNNTAHVSSEPTVAADG